MIYLIYEEKPDGELSDYCKIGFTRSEGTVHDRVKAMQTGNPNKLILEGVYFGESRDVEHFIHKELEHIRVRGEWFERVSFDEVYEIIQDYRNLYGVDFGGE